MISVETNCSVVVLKIPCQRGSNSAVFNIEFISSTVVGRSERKVIAEIELVTTGTLNATPSNLFFNDSTALATAIAAPVVEGTIFSAAARPRRKSVPFVGLSTNDWLAVYP